MHDLGEGYGHSPPHVPETKNAAIKNSNRSNSGVPKKKKQNGPSPSAQGKGVADVNKKCGSVHLLFAEHNPSSRI